MGDTKERPLHRGLRLARIIVAALAGLCFMVAFSQLVFFQDINISFQTGLDAQQVTSIKMKKGSNVDLPTPMKPGSYFKGWSLSPNGEILTDLTGLTNDTTLYAVWDGAEKYAVLSVNGVTFNEVNVFDTSVEGITATDLNRKWRVLDDYAEDNPNLIRNYNGFTGKNIDLNNNFSRFRGWRYKNAYDTYNELRYQQNADGISGTWTWVQRDVNSKIINETIITDTKRFYPPNYKTTFTAMLDYRTINILLYDEDEDNSHGALKVKLGDANVTLPTFDNQQSLTNHFSHWELREDHLLNQTNLNTNSELAKRVNQIKKRYEAGEVLDTLNPLWYYYGNELRPQNTKPESEFEVYLRFYAVYWNNDSQAKYTVQSFTDANHTTVKNFSTVEHSDLSLENPVAYDEEANCFWLYYDSQIASYAFYDHQGVYHVIMSDQMQGDQAIAIGDTTLLSNGEKIDFNSTWGINVVVNYVSVTPNRSSVVYKYSVQSFTDADSGSTYRNFGYVYNINPDLSVEDPVGYDRNANCIWLDYNSQVLSYAFYDHNGVYHMIYTDRMRADQPLAIGDTTTLLGEEIYFKNEWGINIIVNYKSSVNQVKVKFNYGEDLYSLPNYRHYDHEAINRTYYIGNTFEIPNGEKYMKPNYIFQGWQIAGNESGRIYYAGEKFTIPNFSNTETKPASIEFKAVWHLQRLLFDFDFNGGSWDPQNEPDFTQMKGAFGDQVRIVAEKPYKFGYDFVDWTLDDGTSLQPNDLIKVGTEFKILHANWQPKRLRVRFYSYYSATGINDIPYTEDVNGQTLKAGGEVELPLINDNKFYEFKGWKIGNEIATGAKYVLTTKVLETLETVVRKDELGSILEVHIYAAQTKRTVYVTYDLNIEEGVNIGSLIDTAKLSNSTELPQGELFYQYYPFSVARTNGSYAIFDTRGRQFVSWMYSDDNGRNYKPINPGTVIPDAARNQRQIIVRGSLSESKSISIEYYNYQAERLRTDTNDGAKYNYGNSFQLPTYAELGIPQEITDWGTFVGWSVERDSKAGNPKLIYDLYYYTAQNHENPQLRLWNENDTVSAPYLISIDRYAEQSNGMNYTLRLYAVYANDYAKVTYAGVNDVIAGSDNTELQFPVYSNGNYTQTKIGGRTVDASSGDFANFGISVLDDNGLAMWTGTYFVGWRAILPNGVSSEVRSQFANKIWFPGEPLPSIDFDFTFTPIRVPSEQVDYDVVKDSENYQVVKFTVAGCTYRVLTVKYNVRNGILGSVNYTGNVDIVALPRPRNNERYTVSQGSIVINSECEVHVIVPAQGDITLEPRAVQCNSVREFYIGDNLKITGSPVVGTSFQGYRVKKGYRLIDGNGAPTEVIDASAKYDFVASLSGLLISRDKKTLYGLPSHSIFGEELTAGRSLFELLPTVNHLAPYSLADVNNAKIINLAKDTDLTIDEHVLYGVAAEKIILPASVENDPSLVVNPQVLSGPLTKLTSVTFGNTTDTSTWYAFVDNKFVYYVDNPAMPNAKTHLMYVLRNVRLRNLDYTINDLKIDDDVSVIEPCALMGLDWSKIKSVTANNKHVNLNVLQGIPEDDPENEEDDIPFFTDRDNEYPGPRIQPYEKTFCFIYNGSSETLEVKFKYGETFRVFSAQKYKDKENNYQERVVFDRAWSQFKGWKINGRGRLFEVGEVYKVGKSQLIIGDKYTLVFDASGDDSWDEYPIQLFTYGNYQPEGGYQFEDDHGNDYTLADLLGDVNLSDIYLPALNQTIEINGATYQFIGWSRKSRNPDPSVLNLWNNDDLNVQDRILPDHTSAATLNSGYPDLKEIYKYYALYEKVTPNLDYDFLSDGTYTVSGYIQTTGNSINIPFAKYNIDDERYTSNSKYYSGFMAPVSRINDGVFSDITQNSNDSLVNIVIGGAVSEIGVSAFSGVDAQNIIFAHKGRNIYYNYGHGNSKHLNIGNYAFAKNKVITNLVLPVSVESLGDGAFQSCLKLSEVSFNDVEPGLRKLGDFVFKDDEVMVDNAVVQLLTEDGKRDSNGKLIEHFSSVGNGIFWNTQVTNPNGTNKIVWRNTLLHAYYRGGYSKNFLVEQELYVAGYAFVNFSSDDPAVKLTIEFANPNVQIKANAFCFLKSSVETIYMYDRDTVPSSNPLVVNLNYVDANAFNSITTNVVVRTTDKSRWNNKYKNLINPLINETVYIQFLNYND